MSKARLMAGRQTDGGDSATPDQGEQPAKSPEPRPPRPVQAEGRPRPARDAPAATNIASPSGAAAVKLSAETPDSSTSPPGASPPRGIPIRLGAAQGNSAARRREPERAEHRQAEGRARQRRHREPDAPTVARRAGVAAQRGARLGRQDRPAGAEAQGGQVHGRCAALDAPADDHDPESADGRGGEAGGDPAPAREGVVGEAGGRPQGDAVMAGSGAAPGSCRTAGL
jgi:hypothetical protein